jgi:hypothetical protein
MPGHLVRHPRRSANWADYSGRRPRGRPWALVEALLRLDIVVREADLIDDDPDGEGTQEQQQQVDERLQRIEQLLETGFRMLSEEVDMEALEAEIDDVMNGLDAETRDGD